MLNRQLAFQDSAMKLIEQGKCSTDEDGQSMYRGDDGSKCGIGWLIPDERYNPDIEYIAASEPLVIELMDPVYNVDVTDHDAMFLDRLQGIHDAYGPSDWPAAFQKFADQEGLDASFLDLPSTTETE